MAGKGTTVWVIALDAVDVGSRLADEIGDVETETALDAESEPV